jgi:hypothetical protein
MQRDPWLHFWGPKDSTGRDAIVESLAAAGVRVRALDPASPSGEGILCFSDIDAELYRFLHEASHNHDERILAIPLSGLVIESSQAWGLLHAGASDVLTWTSAPDIADRVKARFEQWQAVNALLASPSIQTNLIGVSPAWRSTLRQIVEVAHFTDASVLLIGESGTGKELIARLIHEIDSRSPSHEFVILDCTTIVSELSGSERGGHSPARSPHGMGHSPWPTEERCFSMKSESCRWRYRPSSCGSYRKAPTSASGATPGIAPRSVSCAPPTKTCDKP